MVTTRSTAQLIPTESITYFLLFARINVVRNVVTANRLSAPFTQMFAHLIINHIADQWKYLFVPI